MSEIIYNNDRRYPGPSAHPPPEEVTGIPTQAELDAYQRMFTWGELKGIVESGDLARLMRNKALQARYDEWMTGVKARYGSTEKYLTGARLPWAQTAQTAREEPSGTYDLSSSPTQHTTDVPADLTPSTNPASAQPPSLAQRLELDNASHAATPGSVTPGRGGGLTSGTATPSSAGFVSLANLRLVDGKLRSKGSRSTVSGSSGLSTPAVVDGSGTGAQTVDAETGEQESEEEEQAVCLRWDPELGLDKEKYAVLPNDWPYNIPYGVRHYCVWSRVPIAHPVLVDFEETAWAKIEEEGLGGFTGVTPLRPSHPLHAQEDIYGAAVLKHKNAGPGSDGRDWYAVDVAHGGPELQKWAGEEYEARGGQEVGNMVRKLWDPRGWECIWFVNPPRLQSVPGFSHFHVFARRKSPEEIDASEAYM